MLDDHVHDVPDAVFHLLESAMSRIPGPVTVLIERDGNYPDFSILLAQIERARGCFRCGDRIHCIVILLRKAAMPRAVADVRATPGRMTARRPRGLPFAPRPRMMRE